MLPLPLRTRARASLLAIPVLATHIGCTDPCDDPLASEVGKVVDNLGSALMSIQGTSATDVWTVGSDDGSGPAVYHFDGAAWEKVSTGATGDLWWVHPTADTVIMVGSQGLILELNRASGAVDAHSGPDAAYTFFGVWGASADDVWAVGGDIDAQLGAALWHRDASGWTEWDLSSLALPSNALLYKVHGTSENDVWIVGSLGIILHWDGSAWTQVDSPTQTTLFTVHAGGTVPVAVGGASNATILHYEGGAWVDRSPQFAPTVNGVTGRGGVMIATGVGGSIHRWDGSTWVTDTSDEPLTTTLTLHGVWVDEEGSIWVAGGQLNTLPLNQGVIGYSGCGDVPAP